MTTAIFVNWLACKLSHISAFDSLGIEFIERRGELKSDEEIILAQLFRVAGEGTRMHLEKF